MCLNLFLEEVIRAEAKTFLEAMEINILMVLLFVMIINNTSLAAKGALAHCLQRRTACNTSPPDLSKMAHGVWK